jgi:hypothetical protein
MKGTFFSADFVVDKDENLRLIEINTDTGIVESQKSIFDWSGFFNLLSENNITELVVIYKDSVQGPIIRSLGEAIQTGATFITTFTPTQVPEDSIFPPVVADSDSKFILRMAYDETAILDSEYAKGTLNLLKLFADAGETGSVINFYHSSSLYGVYNTLDTDLTNPSNTPDVIAKTVIEEHTAHTFYKIGNSSLTGTQRIEGFLTEVGDSNTIFEQYHILPNDLTNNDNKVSSIRSFQIIYGSNLDLLTVAEYEVLSVFPLPTSIEYDDTKISNQLSIKHYYEFATNHIKNLRHGFLGDTNIVDYTGSLVQMRDTIEGQQFESYYIDGAPATDDYNVLDTWSYSGTTLPAGSYMTSSILADVYVDQTYTSEMTLLTFGEDELILGGETRMLLYDGEIDSIRYVRILDVDNGDKLIRSTGELTQIDSAETVIFEEPQLVYALNMDGVDNFILETQDLHGFSFGTFFSIAHNCFVENTMVEMADETQKNIQDVVCGEIVKTMNEETKKLENKEVIGMRKSTNTKLVKYTLENGVEITSTEEHPFYIDGLKLASYNPKNSKEIHGLKTETTQIKVGDNLYTLNGGKAKITNIEEITTVPTNVYIITVQDNHNFFANKILVHNK